MIQVPEVCNRALITISQLKIPILSRLWNQTVREKFEFDFDCPKSWNTDVPFAGIAQRGRFVVELLGASLEEILRDR